MSYNIDTVTKLNGQLQIRAADVVRLIRTLADDLPSGCFLCNMAQAAADVPTEAGEALLNVNAVDWSGEGSGWSYDKFIANVVPVLKGYADLVFVWEGGDSLTGLRIQDGKATECDVSHVLTPKRKK